MTRAIASIWLLAALMAGLMLSDSTAADRPTAPSNTADMPTVTIATTTTTTATTTATTTTTTRRTTTTTARTAPHREGMTYIGCCRVTGYDACEACCSVDGVTASGITATVNHTVAMKGYPFGTRIYIAGFGEYVVEDRGVGAGRVDVFCNNHSECYALTGWYDVYVIN